MIAWLSLFLENTYLLEYTAIDFSHNIDGYHNCLSQFPEYSHVKHTISDVYIVDDFIYAQFYVVHNNG